MELERVKAKGIRNIVNTLYLEEYTTLKNALHRGHLTSDTEVLLLKVGSSHLAFSKHKIAFHHIAQGYVNKIPYMVTFCVICNSGMVMNPIVNNEMLHFYAAGLYNGVMIMSDKETHSYWDHITGECLHGAHKGYQLDILQSHHLMTAQEVLDQHPDCLYGKEKMNVFQRLFFKFENLIASSDRKGYFPPSFRKSMSEIDNRLPEMEMGIGVWENKKRAFYTLELVKRNGNFLFDKFNNKNLLIYVSPATSALTAIYLDDISEVSFEKKKLMLSNGNYIEGGILFSAQGKEITSETPNHIFLRWYGFVSTFPNCDIRSIKNTA